VEVAPEAHVETESPKISAPSAEPTFTFGGANAPESSGGSKKILLIVATIVVVAALAYAGFSYFEGRTTQTALAPIATPAAKPLVPAPKTSNTNQPAAQPVAATSSPASAATTKNAPDTVETAENETAAPAKTSSKPSASPAASTPSKTAAAEEPAPLVVKGGAVPKTQSKAEAADAVAPSMIGIAASNPGSSLPNLGTTTSGPAPVLSSVHISQGVSQGLLVKKVTPIYPKTAMTMHIEGEVQLQATISRSGDISALKILNGDIRLAKAAMDAVKQWRYKPYLLDGAPVEVQTTITLNFKSPN
jgi:protein TonB